MWFRKLGLLIFGLLFITTVSFASATDTCDTYSVDNTNATVQVSYVNNTVTMIPGIHKVLSVSVCPLWNTAINATAAIFDATSEAEMNTTTMLGECRADGDSDGEKFFARPKPFSSQIAVYQSGYTRVTIEYTR